MEIVDGEGAGSVVETHATPLRPDHRGLPRTAVIEAVIATSDRRGFALARAIAPLLRPAVASTAKRLWRDDIAYAERTYAVRTRRAVTSPAGHVTGVRPSGGVGASGSAPAVSGTPGARPRNVCRMCCCQPGIVCTRTSSKPTATIRSTSASTPSNPTTLRRR